jgi:hypothetical protein
VLQCLPFVAQIGDNKNPEMSSLPLFCFVKIVKFVFMQIQSRELGSN